MKDTRGHAVDEMNGNENGITSEIGRKRSGLHKGMSNLQKTHPRNATRGGIIIKQVKNPIVSGSANHSPRAQVLKRNRIR